MTRYSYCQSDKKAWIEPYYCDNYYCEPDCGCGLDFEEAKQMIIEYYEYQLEKANNLKEDDYE